MTGKDRNGRECRFAAIGTTRPSVTAASERAVSLCLGRQSTEQKPCDERMVKRVKAKFHYAILVADRSEAGRRPAASWNLAYHLAR